MGQVRQAKTSSCLGWGLWSPKTRGARTSSCGTWFPPASCTAPSVAWNMLTAWGLSANNYKLLCSFPSANRACPAPRLSGFGSAVLILTLQDKMWLCTPIFCKKTLQKERPLLQTNKRGVKNAPPHLPSSHLCRPRAFGVLMLPPQRQCGRWQDAGI